MLIKQHENEWVIASGVGKEITELNVISFVESRTGDKAKNQEANQATKEAIAQRLLWKSYSNDYGWLVSGVDPLTGDRSDAGLQFKPNKPIEGMGKYLSRKGSGKATPLFLAMPDPTFWPNVVSDVAIRVCFTEGAKKAGALLTSGFAGICIPGVFNAAPRSILQTSLSYFVQRGREFVLAYDMDMYEKPQVKTALVRLALNLIRQGVSVFVATWDKEHKGIDDLKKAKGDRAVKDAINNAHPFEQWAEQNGVDIKNGDAQDKCKLAKQLDALDKAVGDRLQYNELTKQIELDGEPQTLDDLELTLAIEHNLEFSAKFPLVAYGVAKRYKYDPIKDYLDRVYEERGDSTEVLKNIANRYFGTSHPIFDVFIKKFLIGAVARICQPGCKNDTALFLQGKQGYFKSTWFKVLAGEDWFDDSMGAIGDNDEKMKLHRVWISEWAELETVFKRKEQSLVKSLLSSSVDNLRRPYGRDVESFKRRSVIVGTTNEPEFLSDPTGDRRYWVVPVSKIIPVEVLEQERDAIWAAAVSLYRSGCQWHLTDDESALQSEFAEQFRMQDAWHQIVVDYLDRFNLSMVNVNSILKEALHIDEERFGHKEKMRVSDILKSLGWSPALKTLDGKKRRVWEAPSEQAMNVVPVPVTQPVPPSNPLPSTVSSTSNRLEQLNHHQDLIDLNRGTPQGGGGVKKTNLKNEVQTCATCSTLPPQATETLESGRSHVGTGCLTPPSFLGTGCSQAITVGMSGEYVGADKGLQEFYYDGIHVVDIIDGMLRCVGALHPNSFLTITANEFRPWDA
jgi:predicted P-loop ATPase